jgi:cell division protein FtsN
MKWIFISLLAANIGYFAWQLAQPPPTTPGLADIDAPGKKLQLLSEQRGESIRDIEVEQVLNNPVQVEQALPEAGLCNRLGPFDDVRTAQDVAERFNTAGFDVKLRAVDIPTGTFDYRVVMRPLPSLQEAFRKLRELKSRDIDSYVITRGPTALGISLGVFSSEEGAGQHQAWLAGEGYEADIKTIARVSRGYWIYRKGLEEFPGGQLEVAQADFSAIQVTKSRCLN